MKNLPKIERSLFLTAAVLFVAVLVCCFHLPIFTDELTYKVLHARYFLDAHRFINLVPECRASFYRHPSALFLPFRWLDALLFGDLTSPVSIRAAGLASYALWVALAGWARNRLQKRKGLDSLGYRETLPWFTLGITPFLFSMNRPEQMLVFGLGFAVLAPLLAQTRLSPNIRLALFLVACVGGFSYHFTMVPFVPLWLCSAVFLFTDRPRRAVAAVAVLVCAAASLSFASGGNDCRENWHVMAVIEAMVINPGLLLSSPLRFFREVAAALSLSTVYVRNILFHQGYPNHWLPTLTEPLGPLESAVNALIILAVLGGLAYLVWSVWDGWKAKARGASDTRKRAALALAIIAAVLAICCEQLSKVFYHGLLLFPALVLAALATGRPLPSALRKKIASEHLRVALLGLSCLSQVVLLSQFAGHVFGDWRTPGTPAGQEFSVNHVGYAEAGRQIRELAARCGVSTGPESHHLIVDDTTYPALSLTTEPYFYWYLFYWAQERDVPRFMREYHSDGFLADCQHLMRTERMRAMVLGDFCCLPRER